MPDPDAYLYAHYYANALRRAGSGLMKFEDVGIALPSGERRKTVKVVPLSWVVAVTSFLFVSWNVVGYRLLEGYLDQRESKHNGDPKAHQILVDKITDKHDNTMKAVLDRLDDINTRLSRIEGALAKK